MGRRFTRTELEDVLERATAHTLEDGYSEEELWEASRAAGLDPEAVQAALHEPTIRARQRWGVVAAAVGVSAIGLALAFGASDDALTIHNERNVAETIDVYIPRAPGDCAVAPDRRHAARDFCLLRTVTLDADESTRIGVPPLGECTTVWVRSGEDEALFALPASVEIEIDGHWDQKGLGAPSKYGAPVPTRGLPASCAESER